MLWAVSTLMVFAFGLSVAAALPMPGVLRGGLPARFFDTRLGFATLVQAGLAAAIALNAARRGSRGALKVGFALVILAAFAPGYWGHAGTSKQVAIATVSDWVHALALLALPFFLTFRLVVSLSARSLGEESGPYARLMAWSLAPIGVAYVLAHNAALFVVTIPLWLRSFFDPLSLG